MQHQQTTSSWKNEPYFWMLIIIPLTAVIMGFIMLGLAIESDTGLVIDDYYKKGKEINLVLARDDAALNMGLSAFIQLKPQYNSMSMQVTSMTNTILPERITIGFYHATRQGFDQIVELENIGSGAYTGAIKNLPPGRWNIQLSTAHWRLLGSLQSPGSLNISLKPASF